MKFILWFMEAYMVSKFYAGIGSRSTPDHILQRMAEFAVGAAGYGYTLRSGGAHGADSAFHHGVASLSAPAVLYLPWATYNDHHLNRVNGTRYHIGAGPHAMAMAERWHPNWSACSRGARLMHARNCYQILGDKLDSPVRFVVCYTPGGRAGGGTGQAIRIARYHNIPVIDLGR
jgi:hypothetical protein